MNLLLQKRIIKMNYEKQRGQLSSVQSRFKRESEYRANNYSSGYSSSE